MVHACPRSPVCRRPSRSGAAGPSADCLVCGPACGPGGRPSHAETACGQKEWVEKRGASPERCVVSRKVHRDRRRDGQRIPAPVFAFAEAIASAPAGWALTHSWTLGADCGEHARTGIVVQPLPYEGPCVSCSQPPRPMATWHRQPLSVCLACAIGDGHVPTRCHVRCTSWLVSSRCTLSVTRACLDGCS